MTKVVVKTVAGFLNASGGQLLIGVDDTGAVGLKHDLDTLSKNTLDGLELHLRNALGMPRGQTSVHPSISNSSNHPMARYASSPVHLDATPYSSGMEIASAST